MEDLIGVIVFLAFAGLSVVGRLAKNRQERQGENQPRQPRQPGPVAGDGVPPWPPRQKQQREPQAPPPWPQPQAQPRPAVKRPRPQPGGEGVAAPAMEGTNSMGGGSMEGRRSEGYSSMVTGTMAEDRARFHSARLETTLDRSVAEVVDIGDEGYRSPILQVLSSKEGLAQAVLVSEVLGKPRALRPYHKR